MPYVHCYFCDVTYLAPDAARGKQVACQNCFRKLDVPLVDVPAPPVVSSPAEGTASAIHEGLPPDSPPPATLPPPQPRSRSRKPPRTRPLPPPPSESDRWDFDLKAFESAPALSEELAAAPLPPRRSTTSKKSSRPRTIAWRFPKIDVPGFSGDSEFDPLDNYHDEAFWVNVLAGVVLLPWAVFDPVAAAPVIRVMWWICAGLYFIDSCFSGGLVRVLLVFSAPLALLAFQVSFDTFRLMLVVYLPYVLYVAVVRFRYIWPVDILTAITLGSSWLAYKSLHDPRWRDAIADVKARWI
jgi:hypothetical protein